MNIIDLYRPNFCPICDKALLYSMAKSRKICVKNHNKYDHYHIDMASREFVINYDDFSLKFVLPIKQSTSFISGSIVAYTNSKYYNIIPHLFEKAQRYLVLA